jgi:multidrug efflux pump subunit AcrB
MWLIRAALRRPITILVAVIAVGLTAVFAVSRMRIDIFPDLDLPVIYVAQPYGRISPAQTISSTTTSSTSSTSTKSRASSRNRFRTPAS